MLNANRIKLGEITIFKDTEGQESGELAQTSLCTETQNDFAPNKKNFDKYLAILLKVTLRKRYEKGLYDTRKCTVAFCLHPHTSQH